jgi:hypothetical protein
MGKEVKSGCYEKFVSPKLFEEEKCSILLRSLNFLQRKYLMHIISTFKKGLTPIYEFVSGGAGVGKSVLIKAIYQYFERYFNRAAGNKADNLKTYFVHLQVEQLSILVV